MTNIRNYFKSLAIILAALFCVWLVSLHLTKQRVQLESQNKINNFKHRSSPFIWNFNQGNDIVSSYQSYWQLNDDELPIIAEKGINPQLSLNFSGEVLNTFHYSQLLINTSNDLTGALSIQVTNNLDDNIYYYLSDVKLSGKQQSIDLNQSWKGFNSDEEYVGDFLWNESSDKISSLVLHFNNPENQILLDSISLPYANDEISEKHFDVDCDGNIGGLVKPQPEDFNILKLSQNCWLPSNYMWLNDEVSHLFPGSILTIGDVKFWQEPTIHNINKDYTKNFQLNIVLYLFVILFILIVYFVTKSNELDEDIEKEEKWYVWTAKQLVFKGAQKAITPYHLMLNYGIVLIPTFGLLIIMSFVQLPDLTTFKVFPMYFVWALIQQFILGYVLAQRVFYARTQNRLLASLLAAAVFSLLHIPSTVLMLVTFVAGGFWAYSWLVFKRFIPLALSHALLALMFYYVTSDNILYSAKVLQWFWE